MCLYTKRILNRRYLPTKKNGYVPPVCTDERLRYIEIECGECFECKTKKARQWRIRMSEEMRNNPSAIFFTGTFTDKRIEQLSKKYDIVTGKRKRDSNKRSKAIPGKDKTNK